MKTVLITGGSRGIGAAAAKEFAKAGWHVIILYKSSHEKASKLAESIGANCICCDVSDSASLEKVHRELLSSGEKIDCIVNNAGIAQEKFFSDISEEDWDKMFSINTKSAFLVTKEFLPDMLSVQKGSIINISSIWGETGGAMEVHYSASKSALIGMTKALAKELAPSGITVNCVSPGYINTDMNQYITPEAKEETVSEIPLGRIGNPDEVAKAILFLATSSYTTGQVLGVNGGWYI